MLTELKSVISVRAEQTQEREKKALERTQGINEPSDDSKTEEQMSTDGIDQTQNNISDININQLSESVNRHEHDFEDKCEKCEQNSPQEDCGDLETHVAGSINQEFTTIEHKSCATDIDSSICNNASSDVILESNDYSNQSESEDEYEEIEPYKFRKKKINWSEEASDTNSKTVCGHVYNVDDPHSPDDSTSELAKINFENRISKLTAANVSMTTDIAAMVAARSQQMGVVETFGDSDDDEP